jgi:hypothetical protein
MGNHYIEAPPETSLLRRRLPNFKCALQKVRLLLA